MGEPENMNDVLIKGFPVVVDGEEYLAVKGEDIKDAISDVVVGICLTEFLNTYERITTTRYKADLRRIERTRKMIANDKEGG